LQKYKGASPATVRTALVNNAVPVSDVEHPHVLSSVLRQGGGLVNGPASLFNKVTVSPSKLDLGVILNKNKRKQMTVTLQNSEDEARHYRITHSPAVAVSLLDPAVPYQANFHTELDVSVADDSQDGVITVPARGTAEFRVTIVPKSDVPLDEKFFLSGFVKLNQIAGDWQPDEVVLEDEEQDVEPKKMHVMSIPYLGYYGDIASVSIFRSHNDIVGSLTNPHPTSSTSTTSPDSEEETDEEEEEGSDVMEIDGDLGPALPELPPFSEVPHPYLTRTLTHSTAHLPHQTVNTQMTLFDHITLTFAIHFPAKSAHLCIVPASNPRHILERLVDLHNLNMGAVRQFKFLGLTKGGAVYPDGSYRILLIGEKDIKNTAVREELWMSPIIEIKRQSFDESM
jgi:hypothetical protein